MAKTITIYVQLNDATLQGRRSLKLSNSNIQAKPLTIRRGTEKLPPPLWYSAPALLLLLIVIALPLQAAHTSQIITVTKDSVICWSDSDGCYNYILQDNQWHKATGKKLRAGRSFLHTTYDVTKEPDGDAGFARLLQQEADSFRMETTTLLSGFPRLPSWCWFLLGVATWFVGLWLYQRLWHRRRIRD